MGGQQAVIGDGADDPGPFRSIVSTCWPLLPAKTSFTLGGCRPDFSHWRSKGEARSRARSGQRASVARSALRDLFAPSASRDPR